MDKSTLEQIAWVFNCLMKNQQEGGTYRHLLEIMGVSNDPYAYETLIAGLEINNALAKEAKHD